MRHNRKSEEAAERCDTWKHLTGFFYLPSFRLTTTPQNAKHGTHGGVRFYNTLLSFPWFCSFCWTISPCSRMLVAGPGRREAVRVLFIHSCRFDAVGVGGSVHFGSIAVGFCIKNMENMSRVAALSLGRSWWPFLEEQSCVRRTSSNSEPG